MSKILIEEPLDNLALIHGQPLKNLPNDLYIPPDALRIFLEAFEGPLDLLLYLIQKHDFEILNIPISDVTRQYVQYIELMQTLQLDLAAEYLVMAAVLMEIKSRMLLPRPKAENQLLEDPRRELIQQLQEYAKIKKAALMLNQHSQVGRDVLPVYIEAPDIPSDIIIPNISLSALLYAMQGVLEREAFFLAHQVSQEPLSVRERMSLILESLKLQNKIPFLALLTPGEGRAGIVVTILAILELVREGLIRLTQLDSFETMAVMTLNLEDLPQTGRNLN